MSHKTFLSLPAQNGESALTDAVLAQPQPTEAPNGVTTGNASVAAGAKEATTTRSQSIAANSDHFAKSSQAQPNGKKRRASVAAQQKSSADNLEVAPAGMFASADYSGHTDEELHNATVSALAAYMQKREEADAYAYDILVPALNQIIQRYKQQGRAKPYRLNGCPTVEGYFDSIGLNYSTVRSWKSRAQQRLLQAATDAGTKPAPGNTSDRDPVPHLNKAERKTLIEASHRALEMVAAVEAGRDAKQEIAAFKVVMNAKRLDDIMQAHEQEPDYKSILAKLVQTAADMKASLPAEFVKAVRDLTKPCKFKLALATNSNRHSNGSGTPKPLQIAPIPPKPPEWMPLEPGKKYTARPHPQGGWGVYEPGSTVCWQKHPQDEAWGAIEAVNLAPLSAVQSEMSGNADEGVSIAADSLFPASNMMREVNAPPTPGG
jgi:hypothetical protein